MTPRRAVGRAWMGPAAVAIAAGHLLVPYLFARIALSVAAGSIVLLLIAKHAGAAAVVWWARRRRRVLQDHGAGFEQGFQVGRDHGPRR